MNVTGWIAVGIAAWFVVSCGIGLLLGAAIIRASAEQARFRAREAMAADRPAIRRPGADDAGLAPMRRADPQRGGPTRLDVDPLADLAGPRVTR